MNVLVTGGTGGIGSWVVDGLADQGHDVVGVDLHRRPGDRENAHFYAAELTDQGQAWELLQSGRPDRVVHCASVPRRLSPSTSRSRGWPAGATASR